MVRIRTTHGLYFYYLLLRGRDPKIHCRFIWLNFAISASLSETVHLPRDCLHAKQLKVKVSQSVCRFFDPIRSDRGRGEMWSRWADGLTCIIIFVYEQRSCGKLSLDWLCGASLINRDSVDFVFSFSPSLSWINIINIHMGLKVQLSPPPREEGQLSSINTNNCNTILKGGRRRLSLSATPRTSEISGPPHQLVMSVL